MGKITSIFALIVAVGLLILFGLDLAIQIPFRRASLAIDIGFVIGSMILAFLSWTTFREQR